MRKIVLAFVTALMASLTAPVMAQSWSPALFTFTQGQTYSLYFNQPGTDSFESGTIEISYPDAVFAPLVPLLTDMTPSVLTIDSAIDIADGVGNVIILIGQSQNPVPQGFSVVVPAGPFFGVQFQVRDNAPLGQHNVLVNYEITFADAVTSDPLEFSPLTGSADFTATIAAVPEPETWAMMLAGIALVGFAAARARRKA